jgi:DNA-binding NtrC family response regulator
MPPLAGAGLSRRQLLFQLDDGGLTVDCVGRCPLRVNGASTQSALLRPGDTLQLRRQLVLYYAQRPAVLAKLRYFPGAAWGAFGEPDAHGMLGESPSTWNLREELAFVAKAGTHCLLVGQSGTGKELAARAIHALAGHAPRALVARNAATFPESLVDAELFGNARNYPNPGMAERPGLVGQADGGTLFLDEIGELGAEQQAHLLRVLDSGGEYQRLGDATMRRSTFRLVGATNRDPAALKHDLRARLASVIELSPLSSRREDVPLLARHLLLEAAKRAPEIAGRFVARDQRGTHHARFAPSFIESLLHREFPNNTRELEAVLWKAMSVSDGDQVVAPSDPLDRDEPKALAGATDRSREPTADDLRAALAHAGGSVGKAARALGLPSRYALYRLMKKHGVRGSDTG